jgi:hypothetical protein
LEVLNIEMNGNPPSESDEAEAAVPRTLVYSVGEVIRQLRESGAATEAVIAETAWLAVLAGDIDDLRSHARREQATQGD